MDDLLLQCTSSLSGNNLGNGGRTRERDLLDDLIFAQLAPDFLDVLVGRNNVDHTVRDSRSACELYKIYLESRYRTESRPQTSANAKALKGVSAGG